MNGKPSVTFTASPKRETLDGNHRLVVITSDDAVKLSARRPEKNRIRRNRSLHIQIIDTVTRLNCRNHLGRFFDAKQSALGAVGVQGRQGKPGPFNTPSVATRDAPD